MAQCYDWNSETQTVEALPNVWVPCPTTDGCCIGADHCLSYNLCQALPSTDTNSNSTSSSGASYSSFYVSRCMDPTYTNPYCQKVCSAPGPPDAVYDYHENQWACCGNDAAGNVKCNNPTNETFQAPNPSGLVTLVAGVSVVNTATLVPGAKETSSSSSSSSTVPATTTTTTQASSSSSSVPSKSPNSLGLSTGAKAGVGIGVAILVIALMSVAFFVLKRRRSSYQAMNQDGSGLRNGPIVLEKLGTGIDRELPPYGDETMIPLADSRLRHEMASS